MPGDNGLNERVLESSLAEMLSRCRHALTERRVTEVESRALWAWISQNREVVESWPGIMLTRRLMAIFVEKQLTEDERADLNLLFQDLTSGRARVIVGRGGESRLPLDASSPYVEVPGGKFVFFGSFAFGSIRACEDAVYELGGRCTSTISQEVDHLVIGTFGSDALIPGIRMKIQQALDVRRRGASIRIIGEDHWVSSLACSVIPPTEEGERWSGSRFPALSSRTAVCRLT